MTDNMEQTEVAERKVNNEPQMEQNVEADRANEQTKKQLLARIPGYHQHISQYTHEMTETKIAEHRALFRSKQEMIRKKEQKSAF